MPFLIIQYTNHNTRAGEGWKKRKRTPVSRYSLTLYWYVQCFKQHHPARLISWNFHLRNREQNKKKEGSKAFSITSFILDIAFSFRSPHPYFLFCFTLLDRWYFSVALSTDGVKLGRRLMSTFIRAKFHSTEYYFSYFRWSTRISSFISCISFDARDRKGKTKFLLVALTSNIGTAVLAAKKKNNIVTSAILHRNRLLSAITRAKIFFWFLNLIKAHTWFEEKIVPRHFAQCQLPRYLALGQRPVPSPATRPMTIIFHLWKHNAKISSVVQSLVNFKMPGYKYPTVISYHRRRPRIASQVSDRAARQNLHRDRL